MKKTKLKNLERRLIGYQFSTEAIQGALNNCSSVLFDVQSRLNALRQKAVSNPNDRELWKETFREAGALSNIIELVQARLIEQLCDIERQWENDAKEEAEAA